MNKFILDMTDSEILAEVSEILGYEVKLPPKEHYGWLTFKPDYLGQDGKPDEKKLHRLYNESELLDTYIAVLSITSLRRRAIDLFELIRAQKAGNRVLEFGCGVSTHGLACAQLGCEMHIVDISRRLLEFALARYRRRGLQVRAYTDCAQLNNGHFDTIICTDVIEHLVAPIKALRNLIVRLKLGGIAHITVSGGNNLCKGHLSQSIKEWRERSPEILSKHFERLSAHNYRLRSRQ